MTKKENIKIEQFGRENPFTVPEGYFSQLQQNIMDSLPEKETKVIKMAPRRRFLVPVISVAASVLVAICGISIWFNKTANVSDSDMNVALYEQCSDSNDDMENYIMMDNEDIYAYMCQN